MLTRTPRFTHLMSGENNWTSPQLSLDGTKSVLVFLTEDAPSGLAATILWNTLHFSPIAFDLAAGLAIYLLPNPPAALSPVYVEVPLFGLNNGFVIVEEVAGLRPGTAVPDVAANTSGLADPAGSITPTRGNDVIVALWRKGPFAGGGIPDLDPASLAVVSSIEVVGGRGMKTYADRAAKGVPYAWSGVMPAPWSATTIGIAEDAGAVELMQAVGATTLTQELDEEVFP